MSLPGADAAERAKIELAENAELERKQRRELELTFKDAVRAKAFIEDNANPNPFMTAGCVVLVFIVLWFVYRVFVAPCASGLWVDEEGARWIINHSTLMGKIWVSLEGEKIPGAILTDNLLRLEDIVGVWDYDDDIFIVGGGRLHRVRR